MSSPRLPLTLEDLIKTYEATVNAGKSEGARKELWPFDKLFTGNIAQRVQDKLEELQTKNPPLNEGRNKTFAERNGRPPEKNLEINWQDKDGSFDQREFERQKLLIAIGAVLDEEDKDNDLIVQARDKVNNSSDQQIDKSIADGIIIHIENKDKTAVYHEEPHPTEFAKVMLAFGDKLGAIAAAFHDIDQAYVKTSGVNEIKSAARFAKHLETEYGIAPRIAQKIAWKTIVGGTTMMKGVDGQPTIYVEQQLISPTKNDPLAATTLRMSLADSHMPALVPFLKTRPDLFRLPTSADIQELNALATQLHISAEDRDAAYLAIGQNMRMFSEIHSTYRAALCESKDANSNTIPTTFKVDGNDIGGIELWKKAIEAARVGDDEALSKYLTAPLNTDVKVMNPNGTIPAGSTLINFFVNRINSEIGFAQGQGAELIQKAASSHPSCQNKFGSDVMDPNAWSAHANRMEREVKPLNADAQNELAMAFFKIAARQPGVYLLHELRPYLEEKTQRVALDKNTLSTEIEGLKKQVGALESNIKEINPATNELTPLAINANQVKNGYVAELNATQMNLQKLIARSNLEHTKDVIDTMQPPSAPSVRTTKIGAYVPPEMPVPLDPTIVAQRQQSRQSIQKETPAITTAPTMGRRIG